MAVAEQPVMPKQEGAILIEDDKTRIFKIVIRILPFWPEEPELWFTQLEGQFALCNSLTDNESKPTSCPRSSLNKHGKLKT